MITWIYALTSTVLVSLVSIVGILFVSIKKDIFMKLIFILVSFAVGSLLGNVFFHLLPESYEEIKDAHLIGWIIAAGFFVFFFIENMQNRHAHFSAQDVQIKNYGYMSLYADAIHNFTDGILIGAGWLISPEIGISTTMAILIHEIPQELSDFGVLIHAGFSKSKALFFNFISASTAILGTICTLLFRNEMEPIAVYILPFAAGGFIYLSACSLVPELAKTEKTKLIAIQFFSIFIGLFLMYFLNAEMHHH